MRRDGLSERVQANLVQVGVVAEADYPQARLRVTLAHGLKSAWLPWLTARAGGDRTWWAPEVGEQVVVLCPDGEPAGGIVLGALYQAQAAAPSDQASVHRTRYQDGAILEYDRAAHALKATLPAGGTAALTAPGGVTITGDTTIAGTLTVAKSITAQDTLDVAKAVTAQSTLTVSEAATLQSSLAVTGNTTLQGTATVAQALQANGGLSASGVAGGAAVQLAGDLAIEGTITSSGDQVAAGISLSSHVHSGVQTGTDDTGAPVA